MFREKLTKKENERGYLYIRESIYKRDKRTLKKIPKKFGDGKATKERGKYTVKKDIYCGRIIEVIPKNIIPFRKFLENQKIDFLLFKLESNFDTILNKFVDYLLFIYEIEKEDFESKIKKAYTIADGFLSPLILEWFKDFSIKGDFNNPKELKRFIYRCQDCGIFDEEIAHLLYLKLIPDVDKDKIIDEIKNLSSKKLELQTHKTLKQFLEKNQN